MNKATSVFQHHNFNTTLNLNYYIVAVPPQNNSLTSNSEARESEKFFTTIIFFMTVLFPDASAVSRGVWAVGGVHHRKPRRVSANNACTQGLPVRAAGGLIFYNQTETLQRCLARTLHPTRTSRNWLMTC